MKRKRVFRIFTIADYEQEEQMLSDMHAKGWKLVSVKYLGWYTFEECKPEEMSLFGKCFLGGN